MLLHLSRIRIQTLDLLARPSKQQPRTGSKMHTPIQQEPTLELWRLAPRGLVVLRSSFDECGDAGAEREDAAQFGDLLRAVNEGVEEAEVFGDVEGCGGVGGVLGPCEKVLRGGDVFCNGLFGEDVFACA